MAFDYTNFFAMLGELVQSVNTFLGWYSTIDTRRSQTIADYETAGRYELLSALPSDYESMKSTVQSIVGTVNGEAGALFTNRTLVLSELPVGGNTDLGTILPLLYSQMVTDSKTIQKNTVTVGAVTDTTVGADAGLLVTDKILDGFNQPRAGATVFSSYNGVTSELSYNDTVIIKCTTDSESQGVAEGSEGFQWVGLTPHSSEFGWLSTGSGTGPYISPINSFRILSNLDFETWNGNTPSGWTLDAGTAGTHIVKETSTPYHSSSALKLVGDGAIATIQLSQAITTSQLNAKRRYVFGVWVKGTSSTSSGTLTIQLEGTGYTAGASEKIEMDSTALSAATSYTLKTFYINMPANIPDDLKLVIKVTGTLTTAKAVYVDYAAFGPVSYYNGINVAIFAGKDKFLVGDSFTFTVSNNDAGVFQTWFRKNFGVQFPSSASPNISDSLAT